MAREPRQRARVERGQAGRAPIGRRLRAAAVNGLLVALVIVMFRSVDFLGLDEALLRHTTQTVTRILAPFYPPPMPAPMRAVFAVDPNARFSGKPADYAWDQITVVEIDDAYLQTQGRVLARDEKSARQGWPLRLSQVAEMINIILDSKPRAIFLDFVMTQVRPGIDTVESRPGARDSGIALLRAALDRAAREHVPVVLADFPTGETPSGCEDAAGHGPIDKRVFFSVHPLIACAAGAVAAVRWTAPDGAYPMSVGSGTAALRTPAAELFARVRAPGNAVPGNTTVGYGAVGPARAGHDGDMHADAMLVVWGAGGFARSDTCRFGIHPRFTSVAWWAQAWKLGKDILLPDGEGIAPEREFCHFSNRLSAASLLSEAHRPAREASLQRRIVMVGPAWETVPDTVISPVLGRVPGVYLHAMAMDNLISYDGQPFPFDTFHDSPVHIDSILFGLIIGFGVGVGRFAHGLRPQHPAWGGHLRAMAFEWATSVAAVIPIAALLALSGRVSPILWLGAPLTLALIEPLMLAAGGHMVPPAAEPEKEKRA